MKLTKIMLMWLLISLSLGIAQIRAVEMGPVYPGTEWATKRPEQVGLDAEKLKEFGLFVGRCEQAKRRCIGGKAFVCALSV